MIDIIIKLFILFFIIMTVKHVYDLQRYNKDSSLVIFDSVDKIIEGKTILDPVCISHNFERDISLYDIINRNPKKHLIQDDELLRYSDFIDNDNIYLFKNKKIVDEICSEYFCESIYHYFKLLYSWNDKYYGSMFKGQNTTKIVKNCNNICVIGCLEGDCTIYLYNPKHKEYIYNKNRKKWAIPVDFEKNKLLYIPTNWFYNIETSKDCILFHIHADTYFTSIYNYYRN